MFKKNRQPPVAYPRRLKQWTVGDEAPRAGFASLREEGAEAILLQIGLSSAEATVRDIEFCLCEVSRCAETVAAAGLPVWLSIDHTLFDAYRLLNGLGGTMREASTNTMSDLPDYADLRCQQCDRKLLDQLIDVVPNLCGLVVGSVIAPQIFAEHKHFYSPNFVHEFRDRHQYDWQEHFQTDNARTRADYYATWSDILFRLQSSLAFAFRHRCGFHYPFIYRASPPQTGVGEDLYRMAVYIADGVVVEHCTPEDMEFHLARSVAKYVARNLCWVAQADGWLEAILPSDGKCVDVAVVWNWETEAAMSPSLRLHYRRSLGAVCALLGANNFSFDIISPEVVTTAEEPTLSGGFRREEAEYRCLVSPYGFLFQPLDWEIMESLSAVGGRLLFYGPAPQITTTGQTLRESFAELTGCIVAPLGEESRISLTNGLRIDTRLFDCRESECLCYPLRCENPLVDCAGTPLGVRKHNTIYLAFDAPVCCAELFLAVLGQLLSDND